MAWFEERSGSAANLNAICDSFTDFQVTRTHTVPAIGWQWGRGELRSTLSFAHAMPAACRCRPVQHKGISLYNITEKCATTAATKTTAEAEDAIWPYAAYESRWSFKRDFKKLQQSVCANFRDKSFWQAEDKVPI